MSKWLRLFDSLFIIWCHCNHLIIAFVFFQRRIVDEILILIFFLVLILQFHFIASLRLFIICFWIIFINICVDFNFWIWLLYRLKFILIWLIALLVLFIRLLKLMLYTKDWVGLFFAVVMLLKLIVWLWVKMKIICPWIIFVLASLYSILFF
jgi:hypothetical protein